MWARLLSGRALWHLLLHPWDLLLYRSQLWEGAWAPGHCLVMDWLSHSIFSSKVMVVVRAFWWALLLPQQAGFLQKCLPSVLMGSCFAWSVQPELPLAAHPLSATGGFSKRTLCPLLMHLPILVHMVEIQATFLVCRPHNRDPRSLLYWFRVKLIGWQRCLPAGPNAEDHAGSLGRSFLLPPFSQSEWLERTSPAESGGGVVPPPFNMGICLETCQHPCNAPSLGLIKPQCLPAPWWPGFYPFYLHSVIQANCDN